MKRIIITIVVLCVSLMLVLSGCSNSPTGDILSAGSETIKNQQAHSSPENVAEAYYNALIYEDFDTLLDCVGIIKNEKSLELCKETGLPEELIQNRDKVSFSDFEFSEPAYSWVKDGMIDILGEDWLSKDVDFVYTKDEIEEVGSVGCMLNYNGESVEQIIIVVKTDKGWFATLYR